MNKKPTPSGPCPKCGGKTWDGPRYDSSLDKLRYACADCRYTEYALPLDRAVEAPQLTRRYLQTKLNDLTITSDNIGYIRQSFFRPGECEWNMWVRDETAARENKGAL